MFPQPGAGERSTVDNYTRMAELTEEKAQLDTGFWVEWRHGVDTHLGATMVAS